MSGCKDCEPTCKTCSDGNSCTKCIDINQILPKCDCKAGYIKNALNTCDSC